MLNTKQSTGWVWICVLYITPLFNSCASQTVMEEIPNKENSGIPVTGIELEEGRCYAKCYIPDQMGTFQKYFPIYQGNVAHTHLFEKKELLIRPGQELWEKRQADPTCQATDPDDCLVWCLVEIPPVYRTLLIADTSQTKDFRLTSIEIEEVISEGGYTEMKIVVCSTDLSKEFYESIQNALIALGYHIGSSGADGIFGDESKSALTKYQRDRGLPVGHFNEETIRSLGVSPPSL